jgi:NAD(P)-dependent dehydrogenase (short-subunit alcohol dehydrogenase family)
VILPHLADSPWRAPGRLDRRAIASPVTRFDTGPAMVAVGAVAAGALLAGALWKMRKGDSIAGEVAIVTGGSRGLGYLLARRLLLEGCRVVICGRDEATLDRALGRLRRETGGDVDGWPCDVGDAEAVESLIGRTLARFGRVDIVINNAGIIQVGPLQTMSAEDFRSAMDTDYWGAVHTTLALLPHMRARGAGRIVNITSIAAEVAVPHLLPYNAAKHAKLGWSEGLAAEVAGDGISVTTVIPGLMRTGSPVHVEFRGQPEKEYVWFTLGDLLPLTAMSAERAASRIVRAIRRREARVILTWQARALRLVHAFAPTATTRGMSLVNRMLPGPNGKPGPADTARGTALRGILPAVAEDALDRAGWRTNQ